LQNLGGDEAVNPGPYLKKEVVQDEEEEEEEEEEELDLPLVTTQPYTLPNTPSSARTDPQSSGGHGAQYWILTKHHGRGLL
jgi:hypothetical protein